MRVAIAATVISLASAARAELPPIEERTLENGLTVVVAENHAVPLATIEVAVRNGSMNEPSDYNGLSHLYEHMFFKGNEVVRDQAAFDDRLRGLGIVRNGTTNTERVNYYFTTTADHFRDAMTLMRDALVSPLFDEKELDRERVVVTGEIDRRESSPYFHFDREVTRRVFQGDPSRKQPLGDRHTVLAATTAQLRTIHERYYLPNNALLVVTGDVKSSDAFTLAGELYGGWKKTGDPFEKYPLFAHPPLSKSEVVLSVRPVQTMTGRFEWHGPSTMGPEVEFTYPADLVDYALRPSFSRFHQSLIDSGACLSAHFNWATQRNVGPITLSFEAQPRKADQCVAAIVAELGKMRRDDYFSARDLRDAAGRARVRRALQREASTEYAHDLSFWWSSAGLDYYRGYLGRLAWTGKPEVARYLSAYVVDKPFVFGAMVSPQMEAEQGLTREHFEALLGIAEKSAGQALREASR